MSVLNLKEKIHLCKKKIFFAICLGMTTFYNVRTIKLINKSDLPITYYFCILRLAPDYANIELGVGNEILLKAISKVN